MEIRIPEMLTDAEKREMVKQMKDHLKTFSHADFARKMGITPQNAFSWISRGAFNAELVAIKCPEFSGDWLLTGEGPMLKKDRRPADVNGRNLEEALAEIRRLTDALAEEQKLTAKAQEQADKLIGLMHSLTEMYKGKTEP